MRLFYLKNTHNMISFSGSTVCHVTLIDLDGVHLNLKLGKFQRFHMGAMSVMISWLVIGVMLDYIRDLFLLYPVYGRSSPHYSSDRENKKLYLNKYNKLKKETVMDVHNSYGL